MEESFRDIEVDDRVESYDGFLTTEWATDIGKRVKKGSVLERTLFDMLMTWRATSYTAAMPSVLVKAVQAGLLAGTEDAFSEEGILAFSENIIEKASRRVPELVSDQDLRGRLVDEFKRVSGEFTQFKRSYRPVMDLDELWKGYLEKQVFGMTIWSSQRVAYLTFYNAYEAFLIDCCMHAAGLQSLRTKQRRFKEVLRSSFGKDLLDPCWENADLNTARLVRHALSHAGGRVTPDLRGDRGKRNSTMRMNKTGVLQIFPQDNKALVACLQKATEAVVDAAAAIPQFLQRSK